MPWQETPYTIPLALTAIVLLVAAGYVWARQRHRPLGQAAMAVLLCAAIWAAAYAMEFCQPDLEGKIYWSKVLYIGMVNISPAWLVYTLIYTRNEHLLTRRNVILLFSPAIITLVAVAANDVHGLVWPRVVLNSSGPFTYAVYDHGLVFWIFSVYTYMLHLLAALLLLHMLLRESAIYRRQVAALLVMSSIPWVINILDGLNLTPFSGYFTVISFGFTGLTAVWALVQLRLGDIMPVAQEAILRNLPDSILVFDRQDRLVAMNPAAEWMTGKEGHCLLGLGIEKILAQQPEILRRYLDASLHDTEVTTLISGQQQHFHIRIEPLRVRSVFEGRLIVLRDVTDRINYEAAIRSHNQKLGELNRELDQARQEAVEANRLKGQFIATASHELRTPLTNIKLYLSLWDKRPEKKSEYLNVLQSETDRLQQLVEDILYVSRLDQGKIPFNPSPLNLGPLVERYVNDRSMLVEERQLTLRTVLAPDLPQVNGDQTLLGRAFSNLLTNAMNYTPAGGYITVETGILSEDGRNWVTCHVRDTGPGVSDEEKTLIFSRFYRGQRTQGLYVPGTGLGLAIAQEAVERHQGWLKIEDNAQAASGEVFTIGLPCLPPPQTA